MRCGADNRGLFRFGPTALAPEPSGGLQREPDARRARSRLRHVPADRPGRRLLVPANWNPIHVPGGDALLLNIGPSDNRAVLNAPGESGNNHRCYPRPDQGHHTLITSCRSFGQNRWRPTCPRRPPPRSLPLGCLTTTAETAASDAVDLGGPMGGARRCNTVALYPCRCRLVSITMAARTCHSCW